MMRQQRCTISANPEGVEWLRQQASIHQAPEWDLVGLIDPADALTLSHLTPPVDTPSEGADIWRQHHRPLAFYYRRGPNFLVVVDRRPSFSPTRTVLKGRLAACLLAKEVDIDHSCKACAYLNEMGIFASASIGGCVLPIRLRYPPHPILAV
jgi:hypothetical protein